jgi:hypothetical protein
VSRSVLKLWIIKTKINPHSHKFSIYLEGGEHGQQHAGKNNKRDNIFIPVNDI